MTTPLTPPRMTELVYTRQSAGDMTQAATAYRASMIARRTVRDFSADPVPASIIRDAIVAAGSAPSGANRQPWHFAVTSDPAVKTRIRVAAEAEEQAFYGHKAASDWLEALAPLGTDEHKPFLEIAPVLIGVFLERSKITPEGQRLKNYYPYESVGIACGMLISALHLAGLATLTHTPSPMKFLNEIFGRPELERPYLLLVVGYPAAHATVPDIQRKALTEIASVTGEDRLGFAK